MGMMAVFQVTLADLIMRSEGARMSATTQGRIPLKMRSTTGWSRYSRKTVASSKMMVMDGMMAPNMAAKAPFVPATRCPTYKAVLTAKTPGNDCTTAIMSQNSSEGIHFFWSTTAFSTNDSMA